MDSAIDPSTSKESRVCSIYNCINFHIYNVSLDYSYPVRNMQYTPSFCFGFFISIRFLYSSLKFFLMYCIPMLSVYSVSAIFTLFLTYPLAFLISTLSALALSFWFYSFNLLFHLNILDCAFSLSLQYLRLCIFSFTSIF